MKILKKMASAQNPAKFVWEVGGLRDDEKTTSTNPKKEKSFEELVEIITSRKIEHLTQNDKLNFLHKFLSEIGNEKHSSEFQELLQKIEEKFNVKYDKENHEKFVNKVVSEVRDLLLSKMGPTSSYQLPSWQKFRENYHSDEDRNRFLGEKPTIQAEKSLIIPAETSKSERIQDFISECENIEKMLKKNPALPVSVMVFSLADKVLKIYEAGNDILKRIMMFPNVHYVDILEKGGITKALNGEDNKDNSQELSKLRHATNHRWEGQERINRINRIREITGFSEEEKTDEEIIDFIKNWQSSESREFNKIYINATAVDWDGTLWKDGKFNNELWEKIKDEPGLFIATGGDLDNVYKKLESLNIDIGVCAKQKLRGYKIEKLIDDLSQDKIKNQYGIIVKKHEMV